MQSSQTAKRGASLRLSLRACSYRGEGGYSSFVFWFPCIFVFFCICAIICKSVYLTLFYMFIIFSYASSSTLHPCEPATLSEWVVVSN